MLTKSRLTRALAVAFAVTLAACSTDRTTGTTVAPADAARISADVTTLTDVLALPAWRSFAALGGQIDLPSASLGISGSTGLVGAIASASGGDAQQMLTAVTRSFTGGAPIGTSVPAIQPQALGTTFVFDPAQHRYVASDRSGAPATGVRFILYDVDPVTGEPNPSSEIGYADLSDEGAARPSGIGLHLTVVAAGRTFVDYRVSANGDENRGTLGVNGWVSDGTTRITIEAAANASKTATGSQGEIAYRIAVPERDFAAAATLRGTESGGNQTGSFQMAIRSQTTAIGVAIRASGTSAEGHFTVNGRPFATVRANGESVDLRGADGRELNKVERQLLGRIIHLAGAINEMFVALLGPVALTFMLVGMIG